MFAVCNTKRLTDGKRSPSVIDINKSGVTSQPVPLRLFSKLRTPYHGEEIIYCIASQNRVNIKKKQSTSRYIVLQ